MQVATAFQSVMQSDAQPISKATCNVSASDPAVSLQVGSAAASRFCTSVCRHALAKRLASFWQFSAISLPVQVALALFCGKRDIHMRTRTCMHESSSADQSANATCTIDWTSAEAKRYAFITALAVGDCVIVTNGDNRVRSAVGRIGSKWPQRLYQTSAVAAGLLVERLS